MKKSIIYIANIFILLLFSSCQYKVDYNFLNDTSQIDTIQIIELVDYDNENCKFIENVICEIENKEAFIDEFSKIDCTIHYSEPNGLDIGYIVIKITYSNGDYDMIYYNAQTRHRSNGGGNGYRIFDREQFEELINKHFS